MRSTAMDRTSTAGAPTCSVLLPCRNAADTAEAALASLAAQTYRDFEIVAVDDGSHDATGSILRAWGRRHPRVVVLRTPPRGIVAALQTAASRARGALLARMDADDTAGPRRLERQIAYLEAHPSVAACGTLVRYFPRRGLRDGARRYERWVNSAVTPEEIECQLFVECPIPHPTLVIRREAFESVGGYRDGVWPEDYDLILRLWSAGHRVGKVPEELLQWRDGPHRLSRTDPRYGADAFRRLKARHLGRRIAGRPVVVCGAGPIGKAMARALADEGQRVVAFVEVNPRKIGQSIAGAPVVGHDALEAYRGAYALAAVGAPGARGQIMASLRAAGFREPEDCCAVA